MQFDNSLKPRALHRLHLSQRNCRAAGGSQPSVTVPSLGWESPTRSRAAPAPQSCNYMYRFSKFPPQSLKYLAYYPECIIFHI